MIESAPIGLMLPEHPRWDEFMIRLEGPDGCNFRREDPDDESSPLVWDCAGNHDRAEAILSDMGFGADTIDASIEAWEEAGGYCDCEVAFNVDSDEAD
jgi:hypothetical protein